MIPTARELRKLWFEWPESRFGRFNFQRDDQLDAMVERLGADDAPAVAVLTGEPGIGRSYFCEAAADRVRQRGFEVAVWHLDLDGFEPDTQNPLDRYLTHLIDEQERQVEAYRDKAKAAATAAAKTLSKTDLVGQASEVAASLVSLFWQFEDPLERFAEVLSQPSRSGGVPPRDDPETLSRFFVELTHDRKLLVHVTDGPELTSHLRRLLIREAERAPDRLLLVISCPTGEELRKAAPYARHEPLRIDLAPLDTFELRTLLDQRFSPNALSDEFVDALMRRTRGRSAAVANQLADLMEAEVLSSEDGTWRLPPLGMADERLVKAFSRSLFEEVDARLAEEESERTRMLFDFLVLASLCGRYVPPAPLLAHLG